MLVEVPPRGWRWPVWSGRLLPGMFRRLGAGVLRLLPLPGVMVPWPPGRGTGEVSGETARGMPGVSR